VTVQVKRDAYFGVAEPLACDLRMHAAQEHMGCIRTDMPVSPHERKLAEQRKEQMFRDKGWVQRYFDGGRKEATELMLVLF